MMKKPVAKLFPHILLLLMAWMVAFNSCAYGQFLKSTDQLRTDCPASMKQAYIWYFGNYAGINFNLDPPVSLTDNNVLKVLKSCAVISDSLGNLQFFTDGVSVWDRTFQKMPNGTGLYGDPGSTQPCIIVPHPSVPTKYYVFTIDLVLPPPFGTNGLRYSIVDMNLRSGLGDVTDIINQPLLPEVSEKITAVKHSNGRDFWVVTHKWNSDEFYVYPVTPSGVEQPVVSAIGTYQGGNIQDNNSIGFMKLSPDGSKLALAISGSNLFEIFDFNNATGELSNVITSPATYVSAYGVEFSQDVSKLYVSTMDIVNLLPSFPSRIFQFDLHAGTPQDILNSAIQVAIDSTIRLGELQLGPDRKIYVARSINQFFAKDSLAVIHNPDRPGHACNYNMVNDIPDQGFYLGDRSSEFGLPNFVQSYLDIPSFKYDSACSGEATMFSIVNRTNIDEVLWNFDDPSSGGANTSDDFNPYHVFTAPGDYQVILTETYHDTSYTSSETVTIHELPNVDLGPDVQIYVGTSVSLHAGGGYDEYLWSTGATDSIITVDARGDYWVRVKDNKCCYNSDTITVTIYEYYIPNAFTPNNDGLNDTFKVIGQLTEGIRFSMVIYNRWGELIFESTDIMKGWDGTKAGKPCPSDVYSWKVVIGFFNESIIQKEDVVFKGTVTLLR
ncbi:MAG: T9SS type B sorting domain-containing protein [Bacteroidetes bacterium]|nr:T9SS type B sorting domain-containing protein [Bacteroidota bacterium]